MGRSTLDKQRVQKADWARRNPEKRESSRLKYQYGIDLEQYRTMLDEQGGRCAICGTDEPRGQGKFHVDHDHETKAVRGLLCAGCNHAIGLMAEEPERLRAAADYLEHEHAGR